MLTKESFLAEIENFLTASGMSATAFGKGAADDPNFVGDLRAGRSAGLGLVERVQKFMSANSPQSGQKQNPERVSA